MIRFVPQNGQDKDCVVATLGTLFGLTRDEALLACGRACPSVLEEGMSDVEIDAALLYIGAKFKRLPAGSFDLHDATGVLAVGKKEMQHAVLLWEGRIVEGNGEHWLDPDDYLQHYKYKPLHLIVRLD